MEIKKIKADTIEDLAKSLKKDGYVLSRSDDEFVVVDSDGERCGYVVVSIYGVKEGDRVKYNRYEYIAVIRK